MYISCTFPRNLCKLLSHTSSASVQIHALTTKQTPGRNLNHTPRSGHMCMYILALLACASQYDSFASSFMSFTDLHSQFDSPYIRL